MNVIGKMTNETTISKYKGLAIMIIGNKKFTENHTYIMGILNMSPESFSDGDIVNVSQAISRAEQMIADGADIIDIGGQSTKPGYDEITPKEEISRILPIIKALKRKFKTPISIDTYKPEVAEAAIKAGADMINDIWGLRKYPEMAEIIAKGNVSVCIMHNREIAQYNDLIEDIKSDLRESIKIAKNAGISQDKIILDVGIGFGKTYEDNLIVLNHLSDFNELGYPLLLGTSRKSVIGLTLDKPVNERLSGTLATTALAVENGINFVRVHDIKENYDVIRMLERIKAKH